MANQWFRMYHDMINNLKIGKLSDAAFRSWVEILCLACKADNGGDTECTADDLDWTLRRDVTVTLCELLQHHLITEKKHANGVTTIAVTKWCERQFNSDSSNGCLFNTRLSRELQLFNLRDTTRPPAHEWRRIREFIFERDDYTCQYCGERGKKLECDHVIPVSRGGSHEFDNLMTACFACNRSKRDKTLEEWGIH